jgi:hypothetical protein
MGLGYVNAIEVLYHAVSQNGHFPVLVDQVTYIGISLLKSTRNEKIVVHLKKEDGLVIKIAVVQTRSMRSVLELDRDKDRMAMNRPEARAFRITLEVLEERNNPIGKGKCQGAFLPTNLGKRDHSACNISAWDDLVR